MKPIPRAALLDPARYDLALKRNWAWQQVEALGARAESEMVKLLALKAYIDRTDPLKAEVELKGPLVIRWATEDESPSFPTLPARSSAPSTNGSTRNGHVLPLSSVIDGLESL